MAGVIVHSIRQLHVDPLNPSSAEELLQHLLGRNNDLCR